MSLFVINLLKKCMLQIKFFILPISNVYHACVRDDYWNNSSIEIIFISANFNYYDFNQIIKTQQERTEYLNMFTEILHNMHSG